MLTIASRFFGICVLGLASSWVILGRFVQNPETSIWRPSEAATSSSKKIRGATPQEKHALDLSAEGRKLASQSRYVEAIGKYRQSLDIDSKNMIVRFELAKCLEMEGQFEEAFIERKRVFDWPHSSMANDPESYVRLRELASRIGKGHEVEGLLATAMGRIDPSNLRYGRIFPAVSWGNSEGSRLCAVYSAAGIGAIALTDYKLGLKRFKRALEHKPGDSTAAVYAAYSALYADRPEAEITDLLRIVDNHAPLEVRKAASWVRSRYAPYPPDDSPWPPAGGN